MITYQEHQAVVGRMKRRFIAYTGGMFAVTLLISGLLFATVRSQHDRIERDAERLEATAQDQVDQTVLGCQRGNELRRAVAEVAAVQARRTAATGIPAASLDPDAFTITSCRRTAVVVTGIDPGPVRDFID